MSGPESTHSKQMDLALDVARQGSFPGQPARLTRRKRSLIVDADFVGNNHAVIWFLRRGHSGEPVDDFWSMAREGGQWRYTGGGGGTPGADLDERPTLASIAQMRTDGMRFGSEFAVEGGGGSGRRRPSYVYMQMAQEVAEVKVAGRQHRKVAPHGYMVFLYRRMFRPKISAFDAAGKQLGTFTPERSSPFELGWLLRGQFRRR